MYSSFTWVVSCSSFIHNMFFLQLYCFLLFFQLYYARTSFRCIMFSLQLYSILLYCVFHYISSKISISQFFCVCSGTLLSNERNIVGKEGWSVSLMCRNMRKWRRKKKVWNWGGKGGWGEGEISVKRLVFNERVLTLQSFAFCLIYLHLKCMQIDSVWILAQHTWFKKKKRKKRASLCDLMGLECLQGKD